MTNAELIGILRGYRLGEHRAAATQIIKELERLSLGTEIENPEGLDAEVMLNIGIDVRIENDPDRIIISKTVTEA